MDHKINYSIANSTQVAKALGERVAEIRLSQNRTQAQVSTEAGISRGSLVRLEKGQGVSMDTFIRIMMALKLQDHLEFWLPNPSIRPLDRVVMAGRDRQRARPRPAPDENSLWAWGDDEEESQTSEKDQ